jgi:hypothetical protein
MTPIPKLTDEAVAMLPLDAGRAELLEEIMSTVAPDRTTVATPPEPRPSRWLIPVAAAAAVAGIAAATLWGQGLLPGQEEESSSYAGSLDLPEGQGIVLDAPGWTVDALGGDGIMFRHSDANLEVTSYDAKDYDSYVVDREHIYDPPAPGEPIEILGLGAQMWAYSDDDHTAIREVEDGHWIEVRAQGVDEAAYLALLGQLRLTSEDEFAASLPEGYVTESERPAAAAKIVSDIQAVSGVGFPDGESLQLAQGDDQDRYQFGAEVAGAYACAWFEAYENAESHDQAAALAEAARVLGTSRDWPILQEMNEAGDYPEVVWDLSEQVVAGTAREGYREGLGC